MKQTKNQSLKVRINTGFTLMEMLIVISIISVLLGLLYGALERAQKFSRRAMTYTELKNIETAFKQYYAHYSDWPQNIQATAALPLTSGEGQDQDLGFIIDPIMADVLQGVRANNPTIMDEINPACIPFIEFARFSTTTTGEKGRPVNPFKSKSNTLDDNSRSYHVLFDTSGDRQIVLPQAILPAGVIAPTEPLTASVIVWTYIPATRATDNSGNETAVNDVILGSWDSFAAQ